MTLTTAFRGKKNAVKTAMTFGAVLLVALLVNIFHPHLWGPDEPREAEIAREAYLSGEYIYSTFNSVPYVEKPPLYYDMVAGVFALTGEITPGAARLVSALLGVLMTGALFVLARKKLSPMGAALAAAILVSMPQFYRATHWILLDIGVGAFVTVALAVYGYWVLHPDKRESNGMLIVFYLAAAAAFLTKGVITLVYLGIVILPFMIYKKKYLPFRLNWTVLFFLIPVAGWIWLFYQKGGIYFLHEHFVNNIIGRLLHREIRLPGSPITVSDVGHDSRWSFYFERLPNMFGAALAFLPPVLAAGFLTVRKKTLKMAAKKDIWYMRWFDAVFAPFPAEERDWIVYLLLWSFLPILVFSIPAIKEVTYILPSYAGFALLIAEYWETHFSKKSGALEVQDITAFAVPVVGVALAMEFLAPLASTISVITGIVFMLFGAALAGAAARRKLYSRALLGVTALLIAGVILGNTPELMHRTRLARKCYCELVPDVWRHVGARELAIWGGDESIRGALPFFGNRKLTVLTDEDEALEFVRNLGNRALILSQGRYRRLEKNKSKLIEVLAPLGRYVPDFPDKADDFFIFILPELPEK